MMRFYSKLLVFSVGLALAGCASPPPIAPQPLKPIATGPFFTGRWYEIARTPMKLTDGCVAGTTDFYTRPDGQLMERDACHMGTPGGKEKAYQGPVQILDPGKNNKTSVSYTVYGFIPVSRVYWMLDVDDQYRWFIVSNPAFDAISLFTRNPRPSPAETAALVARTKALGYDVTKLEMPEQFPPGQQ